MKHLGVTASRDGITDAQKEAARRLFSDFQELHHGDCVGGDADLHHIGRTANMRIIVHPPADDRLRAFCDTDEEREPQPYLVRNRDIVSESDVVMAFPKEFEEQRRGGTWATVRMARLSKKPLIIVYPDGTVQD